MRRPVTTLHHCLPELDSERTRVVYERYSRAFSANTVAPDLVVMETSESVWGSPASFRDLRRALKRLPLRQTLNLLGTIAVEIERGRHPIDAALQVRVAKLLGLQSRRGRGLARRLFDHPQNVLVDEEQVAVVSAYSIAYCEAEEWPSDGGEHLLKALLAYHSLKSHEMYHNVDPENAMLQTEMRATATDSESVIHVLKRWRAFGLWGVDADPSSHNYVDLKGVFEDALGMTSLQWAAATWSFVTYFAQIPRASDGSKAYNPFLDFDAFTTFVENDATLRRWLEHTTIDLQSARKALRDLTTTSLSEIELLMDRPLVTTPWGICCPVLRFLPNIGGNGLLLD